MNHGLCPLMGGFDPDTSYLKPWYLPADMGQFQVVEQGML